MAQVLRGSLAWQTTPVPMWQCTLYGTNGDPFLLLPLGPTAPRDSSPAVLQGVLVDALRWALGLPLEHVEVLPPQPAALGGRTYPVLVLYRS